MSNELKNALGGLNNPEFVIDPDGKIVRLRDWSNPALLRVDLEELVSPVVTVTRIEDLDLRFEYAPPLAARGVVPRIEIPELMQPVRVTPKDNGKNPYYAKLRAEADDQLLQSGTGKLFLGFRLDPIHRVHWNNLVAPVEYEIIARDGTTVSPASGKGPKVEAESDIDPREFLIDVQNGNRTQALEVTVRYFACNEKQSWCKAVSQAYFIRLERDWGVGVVRTREWGAGRGGPFGGNRRFGGPPGFGGPSDGGPGAFSIEKLFGFDNNSDGKVSRDELPEFLQEKFLDRGDTNKDGVLDKQEVERLVNPLQGKHPKGLGYPQPRNE